MNKVCGYRIASSATLMKVIFKRLLKMEICSTKHLMNFVFSNIDAKDLTKDRVRTCSKLVSRSQKQKEGMEEIITDGKKLPLFYKRKIKAPKYEYY
jgi:hypothetical protein